MFPTPGQITQQEGQNQLDICTKPLTSPARPIWRPEVSFTKGYSRRTHHENHGNTESNVDLIHCTTKGTYTGHTKSPSLDINMHMFHFISLQFYNCNRVFTKQSILISDVNQTRKWWKTFVIQLFVVWGYRGVCHNSSIWTVIAPLWPNANWFTISTLRLHTHSLSHTHTHTHTHTHLKQL